MSERTCTIEGCPEPHKARGWCHNHYRQWRKHGDPLRHGRTGRPPADGVPKYRAAHWRVRIARGPAEDYRCADCGGPAAEWAYGGCDEELWSTNHGRECPYCLHPEHYTPRCVPCHRRRDMAR